MINSGSNKNDLQKATENIFYFCKENNIRLKGMYIPREGLSSVDKLSMVIDHDNRRTTKTFFRQS